MPLPTEPFTIHGGCNCKAVRYRVNIPAFAERAMNPYRTPGKDIGDLRVPMVCIDHCNDCRRATSSILPHALITEIRAVEASVLERSDVQAAHGILDRADADRRFEPAIGLFDFTNLALQSTYLAFFKSTEKRSRWFCSRCGTPVAYSVDDGVVPPEWGWPKMLDIWLGTVDREDLEKDFMRPERMLWCEKGVPWVREMARDGAGRVPEHPLTKIDKVIGDDVSEDLRQLAASGK